MLVMVSELKRRKKMKVISNGDRNKVYRVKCPHCGSIIQAEAWEFHHFEGMYDEPLVEPNHPCPNCHHYFSMLKWDFEKCFVGYGKYPSEKEAEKNKRLNELKDPFTIEFKCGWFNKIKKWFK